MKNTLQLLLKTLVVLITLVLSGALYAQEKVTITGKITAKDTGKPPLGIISVIQKGTVDYWAIEGVIGTNRHTFVEKDGTFTFTINKGDTIQIHDGYNRYNPTQLVNLTKSKHVDFTLEPTYRKDPPPYPSDKLLPYEKKIDIHKRIKVTGKVTHADGRPMQNVTIAQLDVYMQKIPGLWAHTVSDKNGKFSYTILKGGRIAFMGPDYETQLFTPTTDTVINLKLLKVNPFK